MDDFMKDQNTDVISTLAASGRIAAIALITVNVLSMFAMMHHPVAHADSHTSFLQSLTNISGLNQLVHGSLIATMLITWLSLVEFAVPAWKQASVRNGILLYSIGIMAMLGAALTDGFVIIHLAKGLLDASSELQAASPLLFKMTWAINQTLAGFSVIMLCAGIGCWSVHLLSGTRYARLLAIAGLLMVAVQLGMQWIHHGHFGVTEMLVFVVWHSLWCIAMALLVLRKATH